MDGPARGSGRVEINVDGTWGAICDNEWDLTDAGVVCRQLGYSGATHAEVGAFFGQGSGPNLMDGVICDGSEAKITDCPSHCWDKPKCTNTETAGVICAKGICKLLLSCSYFSKYLIYGALKNPFGMSTQIQCD